MISTVIDKIIPIEFDILPANIYDNQAIELLYKIKIYKLFIIITDEAYNDSKWFKISKNLGINLLTDINMRRVKSIKSLEGYRYKNALFRKSIILNTMYKKNRIKIEQLFETLKGLYNLENPRLYGKNKYSKHIMLVLLSYLLDKCIKKIVV